ncbi:GAF domain-containing protein [Streptomyces hokutonensis]|uniref:GAF domain-containing protein n=1 Tax=Streptomyces hokutonensis TaxID=1306990 RepID=UPI00037F327B|nr:GAF domain-containing protein [Streptomyces hokutonensis]
MGDGRSVVPLYWERGCTVRQLKEAHEAVLAGECPSVAPRAVIGESWRRALEGGVAPGGGGRFRPLGGEEVERRRRSSLLSRAFRVLQAVTLPYLDAARQIMLVADADGRLLWRDGDSALLDRADGQGLMVGADWSEDAIGTNGLGTTLIVRRPLAVHAAEHFAVRLHGMTCVAAPLHDLRDGSLLGVVDLSGPCTSAHPVLLDLVAAAARLAEAELRMQHESALERLRAVAAPLLCRVPGRAVVVDRDGWVAAAKGPLQATRLPLPPLDETLATVWLPELGACWAEPLPCGWLLRARTAGAVQEAPVGTVVLDLTLPQSWTLTVGGPSGDWTRQLSARHAELLFALASRPEGRTAAQLAEDLFADPSRTGTVRAELARLRSHLPGVLATRPYRFRDGLTVRTVHPADLRSLLPRSRAPVVLRARLGTGSQ